MSNNVSIKETNESFSEWFDKPYISSGLRLQLQNSNVLITPIEISEGRPVLLERAADLYRFLRNQDLPDVIQLDVCIEDENYEEMALHSDLIAIGSLIVERGITPLMINLISDYILNHFKRRSEGSLVECKLVVVEENSADGSNRKSTEFFYKGPAIGFKPEMLQAVQANSNQEVLDHKQTRIEENDDFNNR